MKINEMTDVELDKAVAVEVIGAKCIEMPHYYFDPSWRELLYWGPVKGHKSAPSYSEDISQAWQVVERMRNLKFLVIVKEWPPDQQGKFGVYYPSCSCVNKVNHFYATAKTAPRAICEAALAAVRTENYVSIVDPFREW